MFLLQKYIQSTDLAKKVSDWHDLIRPRLEQVEKRSQFDIHRYGSDILTGFPDEEEERKKKKKKRQNDEEPTKEYLSFAELVQGKEKEEVCR